MYDKVQTILLIIAEPEHYRRKHGYSVITVTLIQPLQMVHYYNILLEMQCLRHGLAIG